jgi:hypothetical protein
VLPEEVQFGEVDYINDSFREIGTAWRGESIASLLPAFGVLMGGGLVHAILGELASNDAERIARRQIESGEATFAPKPFIYPDARGWLILGGADRPVAAGSPSLSQGWGRPGRVDRAG